MNTDHDSLTESPKAHAPQLADQSEQKIALGYEAPEAPPVEGFTLTGAVKWIHAIIWPPLLIALLSWGVEGSGVPGGFVFVGSAAIGTVTLGLLAVLLVVRVLTCQLDAIWLFLILVIFLVWLAFMALLYVLVVPL